MGSNLSKYCNENPGCLEYIEDCIYIYDILPSYTGDSSGLPWTIIYRILGYLLNNQDSMERNKLFFFVAGSKVLTLLEVKISWRLELEMFSPWNTSYKWREFWGPYKWPKINGFAWGTCNWCLGPPCSFWKSSWYQVQVPCFPVHCWTQHRTPAHSLLQVGQCLVEKSGEFTGF